MAAPSDCGAEPIDFEPSWTKLPDQVAELKAGLDDMLHRDERRDE
jgi:hypothetical protein